MLRLLTGRMPGPIPRHSRLNDYLIEDSVSAGVPLAMVSHRPDVRAAELELRAVNAQVGVAQSYRYPTLTIDAAGGVNAMLPQNWVNLPGALFGGIIGGLTQPVFLRRTLKTRYDVAKLDRDRAEIAFQQRVLDAVNEVTNALITLEKLNEEYQIGLRRVETSQLGVKNANLLFKSVYASYLEVITAQASALDSELSLVALRQMQLNSRVELYRALGGGWQ
ncbi:hypothetical protein FVR03_19785 [Pontibacter qinzhouensis]|uniref:TolC family protein n=1 Tax=Pontibacter qinzhouensis TaxID=2603253 RepID=A0A5C8J3F4_9BACT|nr:TolC family protein [Pontibacter qinzhouensis]TXK31166.1 hypothetical protein FVR03_19785 [Pontibacter qinzhouensis]